MRVIELLAVWFHEIIWLSWYLGFQVSSQSWNGILRQKNHCRNLVEKRSLISLVNFWLSWSHEASFLCRKESGSESNNFKAILQLLDWGPSLSFHIVFGEEKERQTSEAHFPGLKMAAWLIGSRQTLWVNSEKEKWVTLGFCFYKNKLLPPPW